MLEERLTRWLNRTAPERGVNTMTFPGVVLSTDVGLKRAENQDRTAVMRVNPSTDGERAFLAVVVCDGMGGMTDGALCASKALAAFLYALVRHRKEQLHVRLAEA